MRASQLQRPSRLPLRHALLASSFTLLPHCADDAPTLEPDRKLSELDTAECEEVGAWTSDLAKARLPASGKPIECGGTTFTAQWNVTSRCPAATQCPATVEQFQRCLPPMFDLMRSKFCTLVRGSSEQLVEAIQKLSECRGLASCLQPADPRQTAPSFLTFTAP